MIRTVRTPVRRKHNTRNAEDATAYNGQFYVRSMVAIRKHKADVDMREQLHDLNSERDWYRLMTVGVHRPWPGAMALRECALLGHDTPGCCRTGSLGYARSTSPGYEVGFDAYFVERAHRRTVIAPVIENKPVVVTQSDYARRQERKHQEALAKRKRTLTDEQRREILRRESVSMRGLSRI